MYDSPKSKIETTDIIAQETRRTDLKAYLIASIMVIIINVLLAPLILSVFDLINGILMPSQEMGFTLREEPVISAQATRLTMIILPGVLAGIYLFIKVRRAILTSLLLGGVTTFLIVVRESLTRPFYNGDELYLLGAMTSVTTVVTAWALCVTLDLLVVRKRKNK